MFEEEFNAWYDTEHVPERLAVPGVETAVRFSSATGAAPKYLAMYDLVAESVLDTDAYKKVAGDKSSPWTKRVTERTGAFNRTLDAFLYRCVRSTGNQSGHCRSF